MGGLTRSALRSISGREVGVREVWKLMSSAAIFALLPSSRGQEVYFKTHSEEPDVFLTLSLYSVSWTHQHTRTECRLITARLSEYCCCSAVISPFDWSGICSLKVNCLRSGQGFRNEVLTWSLAQCTSARLEIKQRFFIHELMKLNQESQIFLTHIAAVEPVTWVTSSAIVRNIPAKCWDYWMTPRVEIGEISETILCFPVLYLPPSFLTLYFIAFHTVESLLLAAVFKSWRGNTQSDWCLHYSHTG